MSAILTCPDEAELLSVAMGELTDVAIVRHVDACAACRGRVDRLRAEVSELRRDLGEGPAVDPAGPDPAAGREEGPSVGPTALFPPVTACDPPAGRPGKPVAIGRYVVVDRIGDRAQGEVFRVLHPNLGREMVLKLARRPVVGDERGSFLDEVQVLVDLEHINLVRVFDSGLHENRPYVVMEYVHGRPLDIYARDEPVTPRRAAALVARLARALALVHRRGVIHRDIKPRNILIDERGEPRLIDFGLARLRSAWSDPYANTWGGTLPYMAPEQARLEHDRIGTRSDLFGLGAAFYFLLTGRPPFVGETRDEVWDRAQRGEFDAGALRAAGVPRRLGRIVLKVLAAEPEDRYATAEDFERALRGFLRRPVRVAIAAALLLIASAATIVASGAIARQGHPIVPSARSEDGASTVMTTDLQTLVNVDREGTRLDLRAALPLRTADLLWIECRVPRGWQASVFWFDSESRLTEVGPVGHGRDGAFERFSYPFDGATRLVGPAGTELILVCARPARPPQRNEVAAVLAEGRPWPRLSDRELILLNRDRIAVESPAGRPVRAAGPVQASAARDLEGAVERLRIALGEKFDFVAGVAFPHEDPAPEPRAPAGSAGSSLQAIAGSRYTLRRHSSIGSLIRGVSLWLVAAQLVSGPDAGADDASVRLATQYPGLSTAQVDRLKRRDPHQVRALEAFRAGRLAEAAEEAGAMMDIEREVLGDRHRDVAGSLDLIARIELERRDFAKARDAARRALEIAPQAWGARRWRMVDARRMLELVERASALTDAQLRDLREADRLRDKAEQLRRRREFEQAADLVRRYSLTYRRLLGDRNAPYALGLVSLAVVLHEQGNLVGARPVYEEARAAAERTWGDRHPSYATCLDNLGMILAELGDPDEARPHLRRALELRRELLLGDDPQTWTSLEHLGANLLALGDPVGAEPLFREAMEVASRWPGKDRRPYVDSLIALATSLHRKRDLTGARSLYERALEVQRGMTGEDHPAFALILNELGRMLQDQGDLVTAEALYRRALGVFRPEGRPMAMPGWAATRSLARDYTTRDGKTFSETPILP